MKKGFTDKEIEQIAGTPIEHDKTKTYFHCKGCMESFLESPLHKVMSPREYGLYEIGTSEFEYPDGKKVDIVVVWCKRCGLRVWDSRNLGKLFDI
jgi:formylmethanofuran dehydrogenase subunit E